MSTSELERRLEDVLHQNAEEAMDRTDTRARLQDLVGVIERGAQRRRRVGWAAGALAAAVATVAVIVATANVGDEPREVIPAGPPSTPAEQRSAVDVAATFVDAYAAYDLDRVASYLAPDANLRLFTDVRGAADPWRRDARWHQAAGFRVLPGSCTVLGEWVDGTGVRCTFAFYSLRSEELGRGPFPDNTFLLTVKDDEIVAGEMGLSTSTNGFYTFWSRFAAWLNETHPDDAPGMYANWPQVSMPSVTDHAIELWERYTKEYVAAVKAGTAE